MTEDSHEIPLAPSMSTPSDEDQKPMIKPNSLVQQKSSKFLVYTLSAIVILSILMLIFGLTIRINPPNVRFKPVAVNNLRYAPPPPTAPSLDMFMVAEITIDNTNFGPFKFDNSSSSVFYGNVTVGFKSIVGGLVNARETKRNNITVQVIMRENKLVNSNANFSSDVNSKMVFLRSYAEVRGEVEVLKIIRSRMTAIMNCTMMLDLITQAFQDLQCN